jgi:cyclopropane-fatty-acyl-phospholipid synthase
VGDSVRGVLVALLGSEPRVAFRFWDGSTLGPDDSSTAVIVRSPLALRRLLFTSPELGLGRAYVAGEIDVEGKMVEALRLRDAMAAPARDVSLRLDARGRLELLRAAREVGALGPPPPVPAEEARLRGRKHSRGRDRAAVSHHYDVSNDFYRLVLGETMTYSCAYFPTRATSLDDAQRAKYELICRKLGLRESMRLLDVGCGWGGMVMHAARRYGVDAVGITLSQAQYDLGAKRVAEAGLAGRVEIRLQDYREVTDGPYDAISSIGMFEHVGIAHLHRYFALLYGLLVPRGRLLNHAISRPGRSRRQAATFIDRYVFPDGELQEVGSVVTAMQKEGFEVRDVESLREHYALTLGAWLGNLERNWEEAMGLADPGRARIWRLYMAAAMLGFEGGRMNVHQVLGVKTDSSGSSGMPPTRIELLFANT